MLIEVRAASVEPASVAMKFIHNLAIVAMAHLPAEVAKIGTFSVLSTLQANTERAKTASHRRAGGTRRIVAAVATPQLWAGCAEMLEAGHAARAVFAVQTQSLLATATTAEGRAAWTALPQLRAVRQTCKLHCNRLATERASEQRAALALSHRGPIRRMVARHAEGDV